MKPTSPILLLIGVALTACSHTKPKDVVYDETMQGTLPIPSFTREALDGWPEGRKLDPYDSSRVRLPEGVHAYEVGRLPTFDRREMHEAHTVYRIEQSARWDQRLPATPMASHGVVLGIREPSNKPVPEDEVISSERSRQIQISAMLNQRLEDVSSKQAQLTTFLASAPDKNKTIAELQAQKSKADKDLADLKAESVRLKAQLKELQDRQAILDATWKSSNKGGDKKP